ncbi:MAG TPA: phage holin, LLH family [Candidatus Udaeobacter sp.]|nr:phage holin, LLH family [Candidatus Udaeobacter sp.]
MSWFSKEIASVEAWFSSEEKVVLNFLEGAAKSIVANGGPVLINAAVAAVTAAETAGGTGSQKLQAATAAVVSTLKNQGLPVVQNAINAAIEGAVANLKAALPAASPAAGPAASAAIPGA